MRKTLKRILIVFIILFSLLIILFFGFRNSILHWAIQKGTEKIKEESGATLTIHSSSFSSLTGVALGNVVMVPVKGDTILKADTMNLEASFWSLLKGTIMIEQLFASGIELTVSCRDSICNYSGFIHEKQKSKLPGERNLSTFFRRGLDRVFNLAPQKASLHDILLTYRNDTLERNILIREFISDENSLSGLAEDVFNRSSWKCDGKFSQVNRTLNLNVFPMNGSRPLPLLKELAGLTLSFDTVRLALEGYKWAQNMLTATGSFSVIHFKGFHHRIAEDTVVVPLATFRFKFNAGKNYLEIDSASSALLTSISIFPYMKYTSGKEKIYTLKLKTERTPANDFFSSLPEGMFDDVRDFAADGYLRFGVDLNLNTSKPDSVEFSVFMKKENLRLKKFGSIELLKMHGEFIHSVYERNRLMRTFVVGPSNPNYTPLDSIAPSFVDAVLTSEDGNFFFHNGFNEESFRKSIAANFKAKKFVKGGSTISMQLVKNIFLTRKKTIARKAEEALIVWLIENNRLYTKERLLEVYMNIIELGPDVYGIGEAAPFYFDKTPLHLTLSESIFLASLLPHPKWFKYSFDTLGNLKPYLASYYRIVSDFMLRRSLITQEEHDSLQAHVDLKGPARELVVPSDTILKDEEIDFKLRQ